MPKLDATHILEHLTKRIEQLEVGDEIADKEIQQSQKVIALLGRQIKERAGVASWDDQGVTR